MNMAMVGQVFSDLTVIGPSDRRSTKGEVYWLCQCSCGNTHLTLAGNLRTGGVRNCGCNNPPHRITHGMSHTPEFNSWVGAKHRCIFPGNRAYANYGGRGITMCERWLHSFENFYADMGPKPSPKHSLDRIDNNGPYSPENCRWATFVEQGVNKRNNLWLQVGDVVMTQSQWARELGLTVGQLRYRRVDKGMTIEDIAQEVGYTYK